MGAARFPEQPRPHKRITRRSLSSPVATHIVRTHIALVQFPAPSPPAPAHHPSWRRGRSAFSAFPRSKPSVSPLLCLAQARREQLPFTRDETAKKEPLRTPSSCTNKRPNFSISFYVCVCTYSSDSWAGPWKWKQLYTMIHALCQ